MQRLYPHERDVPTIAVRDTQQTLVTDLVSEVGFVITLRSERYRIKTVIQGYPFNCHAVRMKAGSQQQSFLDSVRHWLVVASILNNADK